MFSAIDKNIGEIVSKLMHRFSSREGYKLYDDTHSCRSFQQLLNFLMSWAEGRNTVKQLNSMNIRTGLVSNTDARMRMSKVVCEGRCSNILL